MVGATAIVALQTADDDAPMLATRLHQAMSANIRLQLDDYLARSPPPAGAQREDTLDSLLRSQAVGTNGRAVILDMTGKTIASSAPAGDPVVANAIAALARHTGPSGLSARATEFQFDHVTAKPLSRETWLTYATAYRDHSAGHDWILVTAMPEAFYLAGLRKANSRSAMVLALALVLSLVLGAALASMVTAPLRHMAHATRTMAGGDLSVRVPGSKLEELDALAESFNAMAAKLKTSFDDLVGEVATRKSRERELKESEARLRLSEERLKLAIDAASLGIWDWDVEQDRLVWDELDVPAVRRSQGRVQRRFRRLVEVPCAGRRRASQGGRRGGASRRPRVLVRLQGAASRWRHPHHSRRGANHPKRGRQARAHGRHQPGCHGPD